MKYEIMKYCENCHVACNEERCLLCGTKRLRQVKEDDFCLLTEAPSLTCQKFIETLKENDIPCSALPYGSGVRTMAALPLENFRLFVPFDFFEEAKKIVREIECAEADEFRIDLLDGADYLNIPERHEKKIRKKIKLPEDKDFFEYCISIIKNAYKIEDKGQLYGCPQGGRFLLCYSDEAMLGINSKTYEILSLSLIN